MTYRIIVNDGDDFVTYVGEVLEWGPDAVSIQIETHGPNPVQITVALACLVGAEELVS
jgi:hypothetical protein